MEAHSAAADFDRFESHPAVVAVPGLDLGIVLATPSVRGRSERNRGGRDNPRIKSGDGHDPGEIAGSSI